MLRSSKIVSGLLALLCFVAFAACGKGSGAVKGTGFGDDKQSGQDSVVQVTSVTSEVESNPVPEQEDYKLVTAMPALYSVPEMTDGELGEVFLHVVYAYDFLDGWLMSNRAYEYVDESMPVLDALDYGFEYDPDQYPNGINLLPLSIFRTQAEMVAEWNLVCSEEMTENMLAPWFEDTLPKYIEIDGQLYVADYGDGSSLGYDLDENTLVFIEESDESFTCLAYDRDIEMAFQVIQENGNWVLNKAAYVAQN